MRFAHLSDIHLGSWSAHPDLKEYPQAAFEKAVDMCIERGVDFIIISGDFFDTALPCIDVLRFAIKKLRNMKERGMRVYVIPGSHDFSPTGKTMINVLEDAGLLVNLGKEDGKPVCYEDSSGVKLFGIAAKKGSLDKEDFEKLDKSIEKESGFKVFVFHIGIEEYFPSIMRKACVSLRYLPKGFNYYATGHIHKKIHKFEDSLGGFIGFPGALFPTEFPELEEYAGGFFIIEHDKETKVEWIEIKLFDVVLVHCDVSGKSIQKIENELESKIENINLKNKILLIKVDGSLNGRHSDINFKKILSIAAEKGTRTVKKSIHISPIEFEEINIKENANIEELEREIIQKHIKEEKIIGKDAEILVMSLMNVLKDEKMEDETVSNYHERVKTDAKKILGV